MGRTVYDISGHGNHATINGATWDSEAVDMVPPEMPQELVANAGNRQITLSWNKNQEEDLYQYLIYGGTEQFPSEIIARNSDPNEFGTYSRFTGLDSDLNQLNQMLKWIKFGFGSCLDQACYDLRLSLIHISEPTRRYAISYAVI